MIIYRALITPDGATLVSRFRNDFQGHRDKNGKFYFIEGGLNYTRWSENGDEKFLEFEKDKTPFHILRTYFELFNYKGHCQKLKDISDKLLQETIDNIIENLKLFKTNPWQFPIFLEEKLYRAENEICIA